MKVEIDIEALRGFLYFIPNSNYGVEVKDGNLVIWESDSWGIEDKIIGKVVD